MATIVIDPGHYEQYNQGVCAGFYEGNRMLLLGQYLAEELKGKGANVVMTRNSNAENPSLAARGEMAKGADLFISLHSDANDNASVRGVTVYNSVQRPDSEPLAQNIGEAVSDVMGNPFRGVVARPSSTNPSVDYLGVLRSATSAGAKHAMLVEHGFHSNPEDCAILSDDLQLQQIAKAEAKAIAAYFGLAPDTSNVRYYTVKPGDSLYSIGQKLGIAWQDIATVNGLTPPYLLNVGDELVLPATDGYYYTVKNGDSLYSIGQKTGVSWQKIAEANKLTSPYRINPGDSLWIPAQKASGGYDYTVQRGESLYSIAQKLGVSWMAIAQENHLSSPYRINPGDVLHIPG
jgi:N-acetylmuramoyl-L-alanine amidase